MKVGEARQTYSYQLKTYNEQKFKLGQQKQELEEKMKLQPNGNVIYANEAATLEITYDAVSKKQEEYQKYMDQLMEQYTNKSESIVAQEQGEAAAEYGKEMSKIIMVARRIMHGDIVPPTDERKLMEFDDKLYQMAKNIGMMAELREREKHKSLWEDEAPEDPADPDAIANDQEAIGGAPEIVSVEDTMAVATASMELPEGGM